MRNHFNKQIDKNNSLKASRDILEKYYNAMNGNKLEEVMSLIHSSSPVQIPTRQLLGQLMSNYKLNNELLLTCYVGTDLDYIFIRMKQKTIKLEGPEFKNNITDSIVAMKQDDGAWRIWSMMPLQTNFL
jgi:hypothetical protein